MHMSLLKLTVKNCTSLTQNYLVKTSVEKAIYEKI